MSLIPHLSQVEFAPRHCSSINWSSLWVKSSLGLVWNEITTLITMARPKAQSETYICNMNGRIWGGRIRLGWDGDWVLGLCWRVRWRSRLVGSRYIGDGGRWERSPLEVYILGLCGVGSWEGIGTIRLIEMARISGWYLLLGILQFSAVKCPVNPYYDLTRLSLDRMLQHYCS